VFANPSDALPYAVLFAGVTAVTVGSGAYHLAPDNATLLGDRLPIVVAFMGFLGAVICDRIDRRAGLALLPILLAGAVAAVLYWSLTDAAGAGDLRFYAFVQFFPMALIPLILVLFPNGRITTGRDIVIVIATYAVAALLHAFDAQVFELLGGTISGHSLKHVVAALASWQVLAMIRRRAGPRRNGVLHIAN
jgi:hypothetical protein